MIYFVLGIALSIALVWAAVTTYYMLKFARVIFMIEDQVDESLDILDKAYANVAEIMEIPVFSDDNPTRQAIGSIKSARDAILLVANKLTNFASTTSKPYDEQK